MKPLAVIGSCVCDIILKLPQLPKSAQDVNLSYQSMSIGGCAYNIARILHGLHVPYLLFSPIGSGMYGDFVDRELKRNAMSSLIPRVLEENGCCYCLVEESGERTFLSLHKAEYHFRQEWFSLLDPASLSGIYVCGLEMEEEGADNIVSFLKQAKLPVFFAPGPRITKIPPSIMEDLFSLSCILHLNEEEALRYANTATIEEAARHLYAKTHAPLIITLGSKGCLYCESSVITYVPALPQTPKDTIGAGDAHAAGCLAAKALGADWETALRFANQCAAHAIAQEGASLKNDALSALYAELTKTVSLEEELR